MEMQARTLSTMEDRSSCIIASFPVSSGCSDIEYLCYCYYIYVVYSILNEVDLTVMCDVVQQIQLE